MVVLINNKTIADLFAKPALNVQQKASIIHENRYSGKERLSVVESGGEISVSYTHLTLPTKRIV